MHPASVCVPLASRAVAPAVREGSVLGGRYELRHELARGGMGTVWVAEDPLLSRRVAVKILDPVIGADDKIRARFRREAVTAAAVTHPNIVATYDTGDDDGVAYIVMELVDGRTLRRVLDDEGRLPVARSADIAYQVADALALAHARGLIHRDIKPGNVLLQPDGRVKVTDFGIAKATNADDDLTRPGMVVGTARYLAPEQVDGRPVDTRADVYSLGLVLYEMLAGAAPFAADSDIATAVARLTADPRSIRAERPDVPPGLAAVVDRALARDPDARLPNAVAFRDSVAPFRAEHPTAGDLTAPGRISSRTVTAMARPVPAAASPSTRPSPPLARPAARERRAPPRPRWSLRVAIWIVAPALGFGAGYGAWRVTHRHHSPAPRATVASVHALTVAHVHDLDPRSDGGDGSENPAQVANVIDGNPATVWSTDTYRDSRFFGGFKPGVGLVFDLSATHEVTALRVASPDTGWSASVYAGAIDAPDLAGWGAPLVSRSDLGTAATLTLTSTVHARYVLLWFTELPPALKLRITGVQILGTS